MSVMELIDNLNYQLGYWNGMIDNLHTCGNEGPPQQDCHACKVKMEEYVERNHLEMPYLLFGWNHILGHFIRMLDRKIEQRDANRQKGAFI
jgi:hypothetical protein